ncbi:hypothetical protein OF83DRAFT_1134880 [Amylostereum chailletii]|nr:hypothetical protein OF83DRAFT_1134880 [Amylostereum chailletii]
MEKEPSIIEARDHLWNAVDKELAALDAVVSRIRFRRNSLAPVCSLPREILATIFELYALQFQIDVECLPEGRKKSISQDPLDQSGIGWVVSLTHICRHWRSIALGSPALWRYVNLDGGIEWWNEIIIRSGAMALHVVLSDRQTCDTRLNELGIARIKPTCVLKSIQRDSPSSTHTHTHTHTDRIRSLQVDGCPGNAAQLLSSLGKPAPILQELAVRFHHRANRFDVERTNFMLPENLFSGSAPRLRSIRLRDCSLPWTSPLLRNLAHLRLVSDPVNQRALFQWQARTGSLVDPLNVIETMPFLETLSLVEVLPHDPESVPANRPKIVLRILTTLLLSDNASACAVLLRHLEIPSCLDFTVRCTSIDDVDVNCRAILPFFSLATDRVHGLGKVIRVLDVECQAQCGLTITAYEEGWEWDSPVITASISERAMPMEWVEDRGAALGKALESFPLHTLTGLLFKSSHFTKEQWVRLFSCATQISHIYAANDAGATLISVLDPNIYLQHNLDAEPVTDRRRMFPHLNSLVLERVKLNQSESTGEDDLGTRLSRYIKDRQDVMMEFMLTIRDSRLSEATARVLYSITILSWDHEEWETDEEEDDGDAWDDRDGHWSGEAEDWDDDDDNDEGDEEEEDDDDDADDADEH